VSNLLNNAARYTPRGGRIDVICGRVEDFGFVRVVDTGMGIPHELQATIFEMFVQERVASDGSGGLGLGLALSHRLVELHRGMISMFSAGRGHGTTFEVRIPVAGSFLALAVRKRTDEIAPLVVQPVRTIRTVVVDDNDDARELLSELLRMRGYEVLTASDGPSGLRLIRDQRPHVALVDIGLPGMDGISIAEALRSQCPDLDTRLVALTGYGEAADHERTRRAGFHAHLVKPASATAIFECLAKLAMTL
jgi:CheY-like chemotaxis protein